MNASWGRILGILSGVAVFNCVAGCGRPGPSISDVSQGEAEHANVDTAERGVTVSATDRDAVQLGRLRPTADNPVAIAAEVVPAHVKPGETLRLNIRTQMAPGWHIDSVDAPPGITTRTKLALEVPAGMELVGDWILPAAQPPIGGPRGVDVYEGDVLFAHDVRLTDSAAVGRNTLSCKVTYQACDAMQCRRPTTARVEADIEVAP